MTQEIFRIYVTQVLLPALKPGDMVILDNLSCHKDATVIAMIEGVRASVRFLPAYSPDLNPIEKMWSKVKAYLRAAEARTAESLDEAIARSLKAISASDAAGWFASCGYSLT